MTVFSDAFAAGFETHLLPTFGEAVVVNRDGEELSLQAVRGRSFVAYQGDEGAMKTQNAVAFRFLVSDFIFGSANSEPKKYDKITTADGKSYAVDYWEADSTNSVWMVNAIEDAA
jgi:hypothetical protein